MGKSRKANHSYSHRNKNHNRNPDALVKDSSIHEDGFGNIGSILSTAASTTIQLGSNATGYMRNLLPSFKQGSSFLHAIVLNKILNTVVPPVMLVKGAPVTDSKQVITQLNDAFLPIFKSFDWLPGNSADCKNVGWYNYTCDPYISNVASKVMHVVGVAVAEWGNTISPQVNPDEVVTCLQKELTGDKFKQIIDQFGVSSTIWGFCDMKKVYQHFIINWRTYGFSEEQCENLHSTFIQAVMGCLQPNNPDTEGSTNSTDSDYQTYDFVNDDYAVYYAGNAMRRPPYNSNNNDSYLTQSQQKALIFAVLLLEWSIFMYCCCSSRYCPEQPSNWNRFLTRLGCVVGVVSAATLTTMTFS